MEKNYVFKLNGVENYIDEIIAGRFNEFDDFMRKNGEFMWGTAILEYPWLDVELNISTESDTEGNGYTPQIVVSYFVCSKGYLEDGSEDWNSEEYIDDLGYLTEVDWKADNWAELLEKDMNEKLLAYAKAAGFKLYEANWGMRKGE